jgi:uncharacterized sulfatase
MKRVVHRRDFLKTSGLALGSLALKGCASSYLSSLSGHGNRPNILFCISDDQTFAHAGAYGCRFVNTPAFDRIAREGILFKNAFVSAPSCCPSRASVLTGLPFYRLNETSMNHTIWSKDLQPYPDALAAAGYHVGFTGKGWGPGNWRAARRTHNPVGIAYNRFGKEPGSKGVAPIDYARNFEDLLDKRPQGSPFCFWYGGRDPHRVFKKNIGLHEGKRLQDVQVPPFLPDSPEVRGDLLDYAVHAEWFDTHLGRMLRKLEDIGELDNTLVVVTSDNGMPFPRCKATVYDWGTHMPLAIRWPARVKPGRVVDDMVSFTDFAPTFLEAAGLQVPSQMTGKSLMNVLLDDKSGRIDPARMYVVMGIERHFPGARKSRDPYPIRAIRTCDYLYISNHAPDRWPVGDPDGSTWPKNDPAGGFGDCDGGPVKTYMWKNKDRHPNLFDLAFGKRGAEELYDVRRDPYQMNNLAGDPKYAAVKNELALSLENQLRQTGDPRSLGRGHLLDSISRRY